MLLSFASGDSVGEATKWFHTYMMVNLGDPVLSVQKAHKETVLDGLDRSLGTHIADSRRSQIVNHFQRDMNGDGFVDVLVQYVDGYIELILNLGNRYHSLGNIAFIPNTKNDGSVEIGDFTGDKYSDILSLSPQK